MIRSIRARRRKHLALIIVSCCTFLPDYGSATGAVTLLEQAKVRNMSENTVNHFQAGNIFMLGLVVFSSQSLELILVHGLFSMDSSMVRWRE